MRLLFRAQSSDPDTRADCDYAVVELTESLRRQIHRRVEVLRSAFAQDNDAYELYYWGGTADFYESSLLAACLEAIEASVGQNETPKEAAVRAWEAGLDEAGYAQLPPGVALDAHEIQRTECDQMIVRRLPGLSGSDFEVSWLASPKHTDLYVTTPGLPVAELDGLILTETSPAGDPSSSLQS